MTVYLTHKFGLAKEKAQKISDAVQSAASKYCLPPALLLAIISIESRFKEKAKGANGATGLMQVVPGAYRGLLRNVKDLTEPTANIDVGSAILYGYMRSANGDMNAALKSYGGSQAYAQKVSLRVEDFASIAAPQDKQRSSNAHSNSCDSPASERCAELHDNWVNAFSAPVGTPLSGPSSSSRSTPCNANTGRGNGR
ncbi:MAG: Soluble lytic murein transglycosylase and related regulatory proteins (some contain LysM/invasin domains) [uncultured Paraburkholderia sp.]|nr:MAG: Soluble lytic murein transglycosylase and related regulatory proteins (some contain LysM/invasin domains) [uncultured Paraburkholderia sp.]CAH2922939.1 MAG: Soluble lytic murein transglycosylase and related regulatory proteins (some contain LysM/invasin domains) [uncultured Paraburkholderia sp.]